MEKDCLLKFLLFVWTTNSLSQNREMKKKVFFTVLKLVSYYVEHHKGESTEVFAATSRIKVLPQLQTQTVAVLLTITLKWRSLGH